MSTRVFLSHFSLHAGGAISGGVIQLGAMTVMAGLYGPGVFSGLAVFVALGHTLAIFTSLNLGGYTINLPNPQKRINFAATLVTGTVIFGGLTACCVLAMAMGGVMSGLPAGFWMLPGYVVMQAFGTILFGLHLSAAHTGWAAASLVLRPVLFLLGGLGFWFVGFRNVGLITAATFSETVVALAMTQGLATIEWKGLFGLSIMRYRASWRRHWRFYLTGGLGAYLSNVAMNTPLLVGGWVLTPAELGNFALAQRLMQAPIRMVGAPLGAIVNRTLAKRYHDRQNIAPQVVLAYLGALTAGIFGFGALAAVIILAKNNLPQNWSALGVYAPIVFSAGAFLFATSLIGFLPLMIGNVRFLVIWSGIRILGHGLNAVLTVSYALDPLVFMFLFLVVEASASLLFFLVNTHKLKRED